MAQVYRKIGLLNHIGSGNLGDDATFDVVMRNIRLRWPQVQITGFSQNSEDTRKRHGVPSYPIRRSSWSFGYKPSGPSTGWRQRVRALAQTHKGMWFLLSVLYALAVRLPRDCVRELAFLAGSRRLLTSLDLFIVSGGGQLTEWGGPWGFPYTLFKWVLLAKSARVRCMFLNVGAGPISHRFSKLFIRHALGLADYVSFRDAQSQALARQIGFNGASQVFPDCVYSLEVPTRKRPAKQSRPIVGIAPMPYCDPRVYPGEKNKRVYDEFIRKLAMFVSELTEQRYSITPFGTDIGVDGLAIEDLQRVVHNNYGIVIPDGPAVASIDELLDTISGVDYIVTCRFHGVVFAHLLNKPVLAVSHHPKVTRLMTDIGLSKYCIDIDQIGPKVLMDLFASLVENAENIKEIMNASAGKYKLQVTAQFNELFPNCRTVFSTRKPEQSCAPSGPTSSTSVVGL